MFERGYTDMVDDYGSSQNVRKTNEEAVVMFEVDVIIHSVLDELLLPKPRVRRHGLDGS
jgi:hypothetical protein